MARLLLIGPLLAEPDQESQSTAVSEATSELTPSDLALLVLLARHPDQHPRKDLIKEMWPENLEWEIDFETHLREPESAKRVEDAVANLHNAVSRLRDFVEALVPEVNAKTIIRTTRAQANRPGTGTVAFLPGDALYVSRLLTVSDVMTST